VLFAVPLGVLAAALHRRRLGLGITGDQPARHRAAHAVGGLGAGHRVRRVAEVAAGAGVPDGRLVAAGRAVSSLVLPCLTIALSEGAVLLRFVRSATLGVLSQDFLRTARATGLTRTGALLRHGLRNAALRSCRSWGCRSPH